MTLEQVRDLTLSDYTEHLRFIDDYVKKQEGN